MKKCFIVCPIGDENTPTRKRSDLLFKHIITPVCTSCNIEPIRVDKLHDVDSITETIIKNLNDSELVIADLTEHNPNAFFELGYRFALGKPVIHLSEKGTKLPFDIAAIRTFSYDLSDLDSVEELKIRLTQTINSISFNETTSTPDTTTPNINSQILQELFKIQDSIKQLSVTMHHTDTSAVSVLADKLINSSNNSKITPEERLMELIIPSMMNDPSKLTALMELGQKLNNLK